MNHGSSTCAATRADCLDASAPICLPTVVWLTKPDSGMAVAAQKPSTQVAPARGCASLALSLLLAAPDHSGSGH